MTLSSRKWFRVSKCPECYTQKHSREELINQIRLLLGKKLDALTLACLWLADMPKLARFADFARVRRKECLRAVKALREIPRLIYPRLRLLLSANCVVGADVGVASREEDPASYTRWPFRDSTPHDSTESIDLDEYAHLRKNSVDSDEERDGQSDSGCASLESASFLSSEWGSIQFEKGLDNASPPGLRAEGFS